jgi:hypothetical protein
MQGRWVRGVTLTTLCWIKENVELYIYFSFEPSWPVLSLTLSLPLFIFLEVNKFRISVPYNSRTPIPVAAQSKA